MTIQHELITDPKIHEPKGASTAAANTVYRSNGSGSGAWSTLGVASLDVTAIKADIQTDLDSGDLEMTGRFFIHAEIPDVSTVDSCVIPIIRDCTVIGARFTLGGAITVADAIVAVKAASGSAMGSNVTVAESGSAKGTSFNFTANANNVLVGPTWMEVTTDGASTGVAKLGILIELEYTMNG